MFTQRPSVVSSNPVGECALLISSCSVSSLISYSIKRLIFQDKMHIARRRSRYRFRVLIRQFTAALINPEKESCMQSHEILNDAMLL